MPLRRFHGMWVIAGTTYKETVRRPIYYILLIVFSMLIFFSQFITLFSFYQEVNMIREMGIASLSLWAFLILIIVCGLTVTKELDDRTAVMLLSKPLSRTQFLLGKYFGIMMSLATGIIFMSLILILTLWTAFGRKLLDSPIFSDAILQGDTLMGFIWNQFIAGEGNNGIIVLEGMFLTILSVGVLSALCVSFSAFMPHVVTVAATTLIFVLGSISSYMVGSVESSGIGWLAVLLQGLAYLLPNLGYFSLQSYFSEATIISLKYLLAATVYATLYITVVFYVSGSMFERREIR